MVYVYLAHGAVDKVFARRLQGDLSKVGIDAWFNEGGSEEDAYHALEQATHLVAILSPSALLEEPVLGALEFAKQRKLARLAVRLADLEALPPQLQGVLPLNFSNLDDYDENLETLIADLHIEVEPPPPQLPAHILEQLESEDVNKRKLAIEELADLRNAEKALKDVAREQLMNLVFKEKDARLKNILQLTIQSFDLDERELDDATIPGKEEIVAVAQNIIPPELAAPTTAPLTRTVHLWDSNRWHMILRGVGIVIGIILLAIGNGAFILPVLTGSILAYFNVAVRQDGKYDWQMESAIIGNVMLGTLIAAVTGAVLFQVFYDNTTTGEVLVSVVISAIFSAVIGWLSCQKFEISA